MPAFSMIDIHSHILPAIDDGAETLDEALEMARLAVAGGTTVMFATPHVKDRRDLQRVGEIPPRVAELQAALDRARIPLQLLPGAEVYPMDGLLEAVQDGLPVLLGGGKTMLLDSPFAALPIGLESWIFSLQTSGVQVVLAHPERVLPVQENPRVLEELVYRGLLLQINASSLLGGGGEPAGATAAALLRHHWVHFVASDCHSPLRRRPGMAQAAQALIEMVGEADARTVLEENGRRVIAGETIPTAPLPYTPEKKRKGFFSWLFRRA